MPTAAPTPCRHPGCRAFSAPATRGYCAQHAREERAITRRNNDAARNNSTQRGYDHRWRSARLHYLASRPTCVGFASARGCGRPATVVDHIEPHRGDATKFWSQENWQPMCKRCHDAKTAAEDGGFGNSSPDREISRGDDQGGVEKSKTPLPRDRACHQIFIPAKF